MSFVNEQNIPSPEEVKDIVPFPRHLAGVWTKRDAELKEILAGKSDKFIVIVGPCSASDEDAVCDYISRLAKINEDVKEKLFIIPRIYTNKPRTTGDGYKGMLHQPDPEKATNIYEGVLALRKMHIRAVSESHLTSADEMLYPENLVYISDVLGYIAVGARSVENQQHRLVCSGIDVPAGMKNPTSGDLSIMLNSIEAAQSSHSFLYRGWDVQTTGNDLAHAILRGAVNQYGQCIPNYHYEDMVNLYEMYKDKGFANPALVIDCNHSNSNKKYMEQIRIAKEIMHNRKHSNDLKGFVKGLMIESYIEGGNQKVDEHIYGKSITDPCLGWDDAEKLLHIIAEEA